MAETAWLYSVYRTGSDELLALDVTSKEVTEITGMNFNSFYQLLSAHNGINGRWTITRARRKDVESEMTQ